MGLHAVGPGGRRAVRLSEGTRQARGSRPLVVYIQPYLGGAWRCAVAGAPGLGGRFIFSFLETRTGFLLHFFIKFILDFRRAVLGTREVASGLH